MRFILKLVIGICLFFLDPMFGSGQESDSKGRIRIRKDYFGSTTLYAKQRGRTKKKQCEAVFTAVLAEMGGGGQRMWSSYTSYTYLFLLLF